ncbi:MAG: hypothetical protein LBS23_03235, partial [Holosporaceae bacterium]|nr:hypothetical protein [Holosporaceae bacterium]
MCHAPKGWKLAKAPNVFVSNLKNLKNFKQLSNKKKDDTTYKISFSVLIENESISENLIELTIECPMCQNICTIGSESISITFGYNSEISKRSFLYFLIIGFLGGLILNVMPCVLPV